MLAEHATRVEIACDESGSEGEKLVGGNTEVFAHASTTIDLDAAQACVAELRRRIKSPAVEYKANHLLRQKNRAALIWLLGPSGPIYGQSRVYLVEKPFYLVRSLVHHVQSGDSNGQASKYALVLHRDAPSVVGQADWQAFLESSNQLLWARNGDFPRPTSAAYIRLLDRMRRAAAGRPTGDVLEVVWSARNAIVATSEGRDMRALGLDPLLPALARAVESWAEGGHRISVVHDEQSTITNALIIELKRAWPALTSVRLVDSMDDARVQVADFVAGVARRIAEDALTGKRDAELTTLLRPYVDPMSVWGDRDSWAALEPWNHRT